MALIRIHEKPNAVPVNASVFILSTQVNGVWYDQKVTWEQLKGLIGALDNLENYYKKSETYTKTEVNQLIAQIPTFSIEIVQQLPTTDISTTTIYLVPKQTAGTLDYYDEFINLDGTTSGWEWLGKTEIDLSNYYTKSETEAYVKGDGADYIAGTKTFSSLTTTAKTILGAINEAAGAASGAQADATQALSDASAAQGTANSASSAASAAQGTADNALTAAGNAANAASAAQGTANTALTTAQSMAVSVTNTLTPGDTTKKVADVTQNSTTTPIYADDAEKVIVALTDEQTTAPGNPVTITTVQEGGAKSALVTFAPKQDLHGQSAPYPAGGGKNLLNNNRVYPITINGITFRKNDDGSVSVQGATTSDSNSIADITLNLEAGNYLFNGAPNGLNHYDCFVWDSTTGARATKWDGTTASLSAYSDLEEIKIVEGHKYALNMRVNRNESFPNETTIFYPMICLSTETDATFAPYSNICPISGWDSLVLNQCGKNIFDMAQWFANVNQAYTKSEDVFTIDYPDSNKIYSKPYQFSENNVLATVSAELSGVATSIKIDLINKAGTVVGSVTASTPSVTANCCKVRLNWGRLGKIIVSKPFITTSSDTTYVPYSKATYTATFPNTVYGGSYDFVSGNGSDEYNKSAISSSITVNTFTADSTYGSWARLDIQPRGKISSVNIMAICSMAKGVSYNNRVAEPTKDRAYVDENGYVVLRASNTQIITTQAELLAYFDGADICYKIATPTEIALTPETIELLTGINTLWTDGDTVQIKYSELPNGNLGAVIDYIKKLEARVKALES